MKDILPYFIHLGALLYFICFLFRNQVLLRSFAIAADLSYIVYYLSVSDRPLWDAASWSILILLTNAVMLVIIVRDQRTTGFTDDELKLYRCLDGISPADFRRIVRVGRWTRAERTVTLTTTGQALDQLYYVLEGVLEVDKNGRHIDCKVPVFIGELAYLRNAPATANVRVLPGSLFISWSYVDLTRAQMKHESLRSAIAAMLNSDLADKLADT
jgi:hypothetical protein